MSVFAPANRFGQSGPRDGAALVASTASTRDRVAAGSEVDHHPGRSAAGAIRRARRRGDHDVSLPALRSAWHRGRRRGRRPRRRARLPTTPQRRIRASPPGRRPGGPARPTGVGAHTAPRRAHDAPESASWQDAGLRWAAGSTALGRSPTALRRGAGAGGHPAAAPPRPPPSADGSAVARWGAPVRAPTSPSAGDRRRWNRLGRRTRSRCLAARRELERGSDSGPRDHIWQRRGGNTWRRCGNARGRDVRSQRRCRGLGGGRWRVCGHPVGRARVPPRRAVGARAAIAPQAARRAPGTVGAKLGAVR